MKPEPTAVNIGSLSEAFVKIGRVTAANASDLSPFKASDIAGADTGSLILYELAKGTLPLMIRVRLDAQSKSVTFQLKVAKPEAVEDGTSYEKFYDEAATITFTTSASAIAAGRGGYYADGVSFDVDDTLKGFGSMNKYAKCTFGDVLGFLHQALICTAITGTWADIDITNS